MTDQKSARIPDGVVSRMPVYLRHLQTLREQGVETVASQTLGVELGLNPAQIRKDLANFGAFGQKGVGYEVNSLIVEIEKILRIHRDVPVALVGAGRLGMALCLYNQAQVDQGRNRMRIVAVFDTDPAKHGSVIGQVAVAPYETMQTALRAKGIRIAVIAVPSANAQSVANDLMAGGVNAILNFAPVTLRAPAGVHIRTADFTGQLQSLGYYAFDSDAQSI